MKDSAFGIGFVEDGLALSEADQQTRRAIGLILENVTDPTWLFKDLFLVLHLSVVVHADETGWRIGILSAWLWVFTNRQVAVYAIRDNRSHEVVVEILGREFKGVLVSDCFLAYDHRDLADWLKQKCLGHLLNDLSELEETKTRGAVRFAREVTTVLRQTLALKTEKPNLSPDAFAQRAAALEAELDALIDPRRRLSDPDNARLAKRLRKQRPHVLRFLYVDELDATTKFTVQEQARHICSLCEAVSQECR